MSGRTQYGTLPVDPRRRNTRSMVFALFACTALVFCSIMLLGALLAATTGDDDDNAPPPLVDPLCGAFSDVGIGEQPIASVCGPPSCTCQGGGPTCTIAAVPAGNEVDDPPLIFGCQSVLCVGASGGTPSTCNLNTPMRTCTRTIETEVVEFYCVEATPAPTPAPVCPRLSDIDELEQPEQGCVTSAPGVCDPISNRCSVSALLTNSSTTSPDAVQTCGGDVVEQQCESTNSCTCDQVPTCVRTVSVGEFSTQSFRIFCRPEDGTVPPPPAPTPTPAPTQAPLLCPPLADVPLEEQPEVSSGCRTDSLGECLTSDTCGVSYLEVGSGTDSLPSFFACDAADNTNNRCETDVNCRCDGIPVCTRATGVFPDQTFYQIECTTDEDDFPDPPPPTPAPTAPPPPTLLCGRFNFPETPLEDQVTTAECAPAVGQCNEGTCEKFYYNSFASLVVGTTPLTTQCSSTACDGPGSDNDPCMCNSLEITTCEVTVNSIPYNMECIDLSPASASAEARQLAAFYATHKPKCLPFSDVALDEQPLDQDCSAQMPARGECNLAANECVERYLPAGGATTDAPISRSCFVASDDAGCTSDTPHCSCAQAPTCTRRVETDRGVAFLEAFCALP